MGGNLSEGGGVRGAAPGGLIRTDINTFDAIFTSQKRRLANMTNKVFLYVLDNINLE